MRSFGRTAFVLMALGVVGCDHATKHLVRNRLSPGQSWEVIGGVLHIRHALNTDTAFSLLGGTIPLAERMALLCTTAWAGVAMVTLFIVSRWQKAVPIERLAWAAVLGGALGNAIDRLLRGYVIDFIHVHYWPVFNAADIAITVGVVLLILATRRVANAGPGGQRPSGA